MILTPEELEALTSYTQPARQCQWLRDHGWVFVEPKRRGERPKVSRAYFEARMSGSHEVRRVGPDLSCMIRPRKAA